MGSDLATEVLRKYGLRAFLVLGAMLSGIAILTHVSAEPGTNVTLVFGLVGYTKPVMRATSVTGAEPQSTSSGELLLPVDGATVDSEFRYEVRIDKPAFDRHYYLANVVGNNYYPQDHVLLSDGSAEGITHQFAAPPEGRFSLVLLEVNDSEHERLMGWLEGPDFLGIQIDGRPLDSVPLLVRPNHGQSSAAELADPGEVLVPLDSSWTAQGPGAIGGGYRDGRLTLSAQLHGAGDYAEFFLDLRNVRLEGLDANPDGSYDLTGTELVAVASADVDFTGSTSAPNGAQFLVKDTAFDNLIGRFLPTEGLTSADGMKIFYRVPRGDSIAIRGAGISIKFTIGSGSSASYGGRFEIKKVSIIKR